MKCIIKKLKKFVNFIKCVVENEFKKKLEIRLDRSFTRINAYSIVLPIKTRKFM